MEQVDQFFQDLSHDGVPPEEGLILLQQSNGCANTFLRMACVLSNPSGMDRYLSISSFHLHQVPSTSYTAYYMKADYLEIDDHDIRPSINPYIDKMKSSRPLRPLPTD